MDTEGIMSTRTKLIPNQFQSVFSITLEPHLANNALISRIGDVIIKHQRRISASQSSSICHDTRLN